MNPVAHNINLNIIKALQTNSVTCGHGCGISDWSRKSFYIYYEQYIMNNKYT